MCGKPLLQRARIDRPNADTLIKARRSEALSVGAEGQSTYHATMGIELAYEFACCRTANGNLTIISANGNEGSIGRPSK